MESDAVEEFIPTVKEKYARETDVTPEVYVCVAAEGAGPALEEAE